MAAFYLVFLTSKVAVFLSILYKITRVIRCKLMGRLCFLLAICSAIEFYKRIFLAFVGFFVMDCASSLKLLMTKYNDFGCGFFIFGCFSRFFNVLALLFMFILGFKFLQFKGKSIQDRTNNGLLLKSSKMVCGNDDHGGKNSSFECGATRVNRVLCRSCGDQRFEENNEFLRINSTGFRHDEGAEVEEMRGNEDEVFDVMALRRMVKAERRKANAAQSELEKERMAASSSVDEAMAMILRLQNEKSALQIKANQLERVAEEKQSHDQDVIHSLQWIIMRHESERGLLEDQLRLCREKLKGFIKGEEWDQFDSACPTPSAFNSALESLDDDEMIKALDFDSSVM
ncbi:protein FLOURY 1-like [Silene latifolia]|uniref:protein FLOURY 1-like n=1 Tax=Silene latifolia TaxID=37657 RepID=UPI003D788242